MVDLTKKVQLSHYPTTGDGSVIIYDEYAPILQELGIGSFDDVYDLAGGTVIKQQQDRSVLRFEVGERVFFLKRHASEQCQRGRKLLHTDFHWCSEGGKEFSFCYSFRLAGLATVVPVAMGEKVLPDGTVTSFFLTEDFMPYVQLEELIRHTPEVLSGEEHQVKRRNILIAVGRYARSMHQAGFNHQDFNATHVVLFGFKEGVPTMALFDLQRVDQNPLQKFRWVIKALAEFNYSSRENNVFTDADRLFLFHVYCDKVDQPLNWLEKLQWQWTQGKTNRIARHTAKRHARNRKRRQNSSLQ